MNFDKLPYCPFMKHMDCFARTNDSKCYCLEDTNFSGKECPFYKPEDKVKNLVSARDYKEAKNIRDIIK